jgi:hypothetical protein
VNNMLFEQIIVTVWDQSDCRVSSVQSQCRIAGHSVSMPALLFYVFNVLNLLRLYDYSLSGFRAFVCRQGTISYVFQLLLIKCTKERI